MKTIFLSVVLWASAALAQLTITTSADFQAPLSPYGHWVRVGSAMAFQPSPEFVGTDFVPYSTHGHWVATARGWSFQSELPFAWATFHYGRWWYDDDLGWLWFPGTRWAPAWVEWRVSGGFTGWAPLPPPAYVSTYRPRWFFVDSPHFRARDPWRHRVDAPRGWEHGAVAIAPPIQRPRVSVVVNAPPPPPPPHRAISIAPPPPPRVIVRQAPVPPAPTVVVHPATPPPPPGAPPPPGNQRRRGKH